MNIGMIVPILIASDKGVFSGGHANSMANLTKELSQRNNVYVFAGTPYRNCNNLRRLEISNATVIPIPIYNKPHSLKYGIEFLIKTLKVIKKIKRQFGLDILHIHSGYPFYGLIGVFASKIFWLPSVFTLYCPVSLEVKDSKIPSFLRIAVKYSLDNQRLIITISNNVLLSLKNLCISFTKIKQIGPPIDLSIFNGDLYKSNKKNSTPKLLFIGNTTISKGLEVLIEAMQYVISRYPSVKLIIALDKSTKKGVYEDKRSEIIYDKIKKYNLQANIEELGMVENLPLLFSKADIFITPFLNTFGPADYPISTLEAMAMGKPIVASRVGGIPEIIKTGSNGILVEPGNERDLADAILTLLRDKKLQEQISLANMKIIKKDFNSVKISSLILKEYKRIMSENQK